MVFLARVGDRRLRIHLQLTRPAQLFHYAELRKVLIVQADRLAKDIGYNDNAPL
jgi:hypothetical protein